MKIIVNQVPAEGLYLEEEIKPAELDLETDLIKPRSDLKIKAQVYRITNALTVKLNIQAFLCADCSRCLEEFGWEYNKDAQLSFPLDSDTTFIDTFAPPKAGLSINPEPFDKLRVVSEVEPQTPGSRPGCVEWIDLNPGIREEVILDYPIKPLCRITCKGLCVKCGKNKNEGGCNCAIT